MLFLSSFRAVTRNAAVRVSFALILGAAFSPPLRAADPLTLDDALRLAQERSRQLPAQEAAARSAREMAVAAGQRPDPILTAGINDFPVSRPNAFSLTRDSFTMRQIGVMQELTRGSKLEARSARMEREADVATAGRAVALATLQRDTAIAWLDR
ncbi:MAG: TolC family protein, partial [Pseudomonadota bacterium]|nr:TolC family protein [Pseudomonadota bacterium]